MKTKEKVLAALAGLIPEEAQKEVAGAVDAFLDESRQTLEAEYNAKLEEAYQIIAKEGHESEKVAEKGYSEAYQIICDLRDRLEVQREEFEHTLEENYEEAYQMLVAERAKNENLEVDLYEEYDKKVKEIKEYIVEKLNQYLELKTPELTESVKRSVLNDPALAEHKVALDKILEVAVNYLDEDDHLHATSSKVEQLAKNAEELKGQVRILEAKNTRLATENGKLNEAVRQQGEMLTEQAQATEQKERAKKAKHVEGRGQRVTENTVVIGEQTAPATAGETVTEGDERGTRFVEQVGEELTKQWSRLAGLPNTK